MDKKIKTYAIIQNGKIMDYYNSLHSVFMKKIYTTAEGARIALRKIPEQSNAKIVEVEIKLKNNE